MRSLRGVQVQIFGQVYNLRAGGDAERVRRVAELVDRKMNAVSDRGAAADSYRVAVLAALEIADELVRLQEDHERYRGRINEKRNRLAKLLDGVDDRAATLFPAAD